MLGSPSRVGWAMAVLSKRLCSSSMRDERGTVRRRGICLLRSEVYLSQRHAMLSGDASAVFVFRRENRRPAFQPTELALHGAPGRLHRTRFALKLVATDRIPANAERRGLTKENLLQRR